MSRRRSSGEGSLELLLDTICNTFGGVLFLAMLVSLMLTQTRRKSDAVPADPAPALSAADMIRLDMRAENAARAVESLGEQVEQARRVAEALDVPDAAHLLDAMAVAESRVRSEETRRATLLAKLAAEQAATAQSQAAKVADDRGRQDVARAAEAARKRLAEAAVDREKLMSSAIRLRDQAARQATVSTTGHSPRMQKTRKQEFGLLIRYGRLFPMKVFRGGRLVVNDKDFVVSPGILQNTARAKPHAGVDLTSADGHDAALRRITSDFPPTAWYACLVVHPDSFDEYLVVKNWLVEHGYECRLFPTADGVQDRGAVDVDVQ